MANQRLLSFCPTKNRPEMLKKLLYSFDRCKSKGSEIFVFVAHESNCIDEYKKVLKGRKYVVGKRPSNAVEIANYVTCRLFPNVPYYQCLNDDHYICTKGFDNILIDKIEKDGFGWGLAFGQYTTDLKQWQTHRHPSAEVISGNIPRTLGYFCTPLLRNMRADTFFRDITEPFGRSFCIPEVSIEHLHWKNKTAEKDQVYMDQYSTESIKYGNEGYGRWVREQRKADIEKLIIAMAKDGIKL